MQRSQSWSQNSNGLQRQQLSSAPQLFVIRGPGRGREIPEGRWHVWDSLLAASPVRRVENPHMSDTAKAEGQRRDVGRDKGHLKDT